MPEQNISVGTDGFPASRWTPPGGGVEFVPGASPAAAPVPPVPAAPVPLAQAAPAPAEPVAVAPKPKARFAGTGHTRIVPLAVPIEFGGRTFDSINVRRLTGRDFREHFEAPREFRGRLPFFIDDAGDPVPEKVMDALGFEDDIAVSEAIEDFIPAALKADRAPPPSPAPRAGEGSPRP